MTAVNVPPEQVVVALLGEATVIPAGKVSTKSKPLAANVPMLLSMVNCKLTTSFTKAVIGLNTLVNAGADSTVNVSAAVPELPAFEVKSPLVLMN